MKHFNQLSAQLKNSKLTAKYSEDNGGELACIWEDNSDDESLLVINRIKINQKALNDIVTHELEFVLNEFFNHVEGDNWKQLQIDRIKDVVEGKYNLLKDYKIDKRGLIVANDFGF